MNPLRLSAYFSSSCLLLGVFQACSDAPPNKSRDAGVVDDAGDSAVSDATHDGAPDGGDAARQLDATKSVEAGAEAGPRETERDADADGPRDCCADEACSKPDLTRCADSELCQLGPNGKPEVCTSDCPEAQQCSGLCCPFGAACRDDKCVLGDLAVESDDTLWEYAQFLSLGADHCLVQDNVVAQPGNYTMLEMGVLVKNVGRVVYEMNALDEAWAGSTVAAFCQDGYALSGFLKVELKDAAGKVVRDATPSTLCQKDGDDFVCGVGGLKRGETVKLPAGIGNMLDITGLAAGDYTVEITVNPDHVLAEKSFSNNTLTLEFSHNGCDGFSCGGGCCEPGSLCVDDVCQEPVNPCCVSDGWGFDECGLANNGTCDCNGDAGWDYEDCWRGNECCTESDHCGWANDHACDCGGRFAWDHADCSSDGCCGDEDICGLANDGYCQCGGNAEWEKDCQSSQNTSCDAALEIVAAGVYYSTVGHGGGFPNSSDAGAPWAPGAPELPGPFGGAGGSASFISLAPVAVDAGTQEPNDGGVESCGASGDAAFFSFTLEHSEVVYLDVLWSEYPTSLSLYQTNCDAAPIHCSEEACNSSSGMFGGQLAAGTYIVEARTKSPGVSNNVRLKFDRSGNVQGTLIDHVGSYSGNTLVGEATPAGTCEGYYYEGPGISLPFPIGGDGDGPGISLPFPIGGDGDGDGDYVQVDGGSMADAAPWHDEPSSSYNGPNDVYFFAGCPGPVFVSTCGTSTFDSSIAMFDEISSYSYTDQCSTWNNSCSSDPNGVATALYSWDGGINYIVVDSEVDGAGGEYQMYVAY